MDAFGAVVAADQRQLGVVAADMGDDLGERHRELGADDQEPFLVGLGRGDLQHRDHLACGGQPVGHERSVGDLEDFFNTCAGVAQDLDHGPRPERAVGL